jgi:hypothetical protein
MKHDVHNHAEKLSKWKKGLSSNKLITKKNKELFLMFLEAKRLNKDSSLQSPATHNKFIEKMTVMCNYYNNMGIDPITKLYAPKKITDKKLIKAMKGKSDFEKNKMTETYFKNEGTKKAQLFFDSLNARGKKCDTHLMIMRNFWNVWIKHADENEYQTIPDIIAGVKIKKSVTKFVLVTKEQLEEILIKTYINTQTGIETPYFNKGERLLLRIAFDSLIRCPSEMFSMLVSFVENRNGVVWLNVPDEIAKGKKGRSFNLMYYGSELLKFIKEEKLEANDRIFKDVSYEYLSDKFKEVTIKTLGEGLSHPKAGGKYKEISLYDLRHSGAVHIRILASKNSNITLDAIRERGGWVDFRMLNYYTKCIGIDGEIDMNEILPEVDKTRLETEIADLKIAMKKKDEENDLKIKEQVKAMAEEYFNQQKMEMRKMFNQKIS